MHTEAIGASTADSVESSLFSAVTSASSLDEELITHDDRIGYLVTGRSFASVHQSDNPPFTAVVSGSLPVSTSAFIDVNELEAELVFHSLKDELLRKRNSEEQERFVFDVVKPIVEQQGVPFLRRIDGLIQGRKMPALARHYFLYMLSYIEDAAVSAYSFKVLVRYRESTDPWTRTGAEEGLEHLASR